VLLLCWPQQPGQPSRLHPDPALSHRHARLPAARRPAAVGSRWPPASLSEPSEEFRLSALYGAAGRNHDPELTRLLLQALERAGTLRRFVPFDVDPAVLEEASEAVAAEFAGLEVEPVVGDFERHLGVLPTGPRRLLAFLGSTIGNLDPAQRATFLADVRGTLGEGDAFLLGTDLVKDPARLVAAYDDAQGVTAAFNKNVLAVLDRELGADFKAEAFEHRTVWDAEQEWIEMRLRATTAQRVHIRDLDLTVDFAAGEELRTEISSKFTRERLEEVYAHAGLELCGWFTDAAGDYALSLARRPA